MKLVNFQCGARSVLDKATGEFKTDFAGGAVGIVLNGKTMDLHNDFSFDGFSYNPLARTLNLGWTRLQEEWVENNVPKSLHIEFTNVCELAFDPRDTDMPFSEDDCVSWFCLSDYVSIGEDTEGLKQYWEDDAKPHILVIGFQSGSTLRICAETAKAEIVV